MRTISLTELKNMGEAARGSINHIYLHWSAGRHGQYFDDYHINVDADGSLHTNVTSLKEVLSHTWKRNTGAVAISLCACYNATPERCKVGDFGEEPPTPGMIDGMAKAVAVLCESLGLPINKDTVMTHAEVADTMGSPDNYGPLTTWERWDLWYLIDYPSGVIGNGGDIIRGKAIYWEEYWEQNPGERP